tara:strand:+ start:945 stop:1250 length:306 start_codon:yes stop_codon:yes gene_type:complete
MKKFFVITLILSLILFTAFIKNSTKRIDDEIYTVNENIRDLEKNFNNIKLEHEYLSSADKLHEFQNLYFDDELVKNDIQNFKVIIPKLDKLKITQLKFSDE